MVASVLVSKRRRDCLHQTPIEAQPPQGGGAGPQARGPRNDSVPSCRPIHSVDSWTRRSRSVVRGLGGGAEQSPSILRDPDEKTERERVSNPSDTLPGLLANRIVVEVLDDGAAVLGLASPFVERRQVVLGVGVLDVGQQLAALSGEEQAPAQQVAGSAHLARIDIGVREVAATQQGGNLVGVDSVVLRLAAVDGLHVKGVAEDKGEALLATEVGHPVPAEEAFDGDRQVLSVGSESLQQPFSVTGQLPVHQGLALLVQDADIEAAGVEVDTAVMKMLSGVESHRGLLSWSSQPKPVVVGRRGPQISIHALQQTFAAPGGWCCFESCCCGKRR